MFVNLCSFSIDENIPFSFIDYFEKTNYNVEHIKKIGKSGIKNGEVYQYAELKKRWIVTRDADFQNYLKFQTYQIGGIILFKTTLSNKDYLLSMLKQLIQKHQRRLQTKLLITIEDNRITFLK